MKVNFSFEVTDDMLTNLLSSMRYSHYWCNNAGDFDLISVQQRITDGESWNANEFDEDDGKIIKRYAVSKNTLARGLRKMAVEYPKHFADILTGNDDGNTADVLLQLSTIGEIKYG